jgi:hypothetical protein
MSWLITGLLAALGAVTLIIVLGVAWRVVLEVLDVLVLRPGAWLVELVPERAGYWIGTVVYSVIAGSFVLAFYGLAILIAVGGR